MRFHLSFEYESNGRKSSGEQVVINDTGLDDAAMTIARERGVSSIFVKKRFFSGKPANQAEVINRRFDCIALSPHSQEAEPATPARQERVAATGEIS